ncbi:MAG: hypothetical protein ACC661_11030 [Verrucomicrobiales bacterium]
MPIAGLTLTLHRDDALAAAALEELRACPEIETGERRGCWLPVVSDVADAKASRDLHRWIESLAGIAYVDVVYVGFDDASPSPEGNPSAAVSAPLIPSIE